MKIPFLRELPRAFNALKPTVDPIVKAINDGIVYADDGSGIKAERQQDGRVKLSGGGGGSGVLETVSGAVNGVPATLNVQTDGKGWLPFS